MRNFFLVILVVGLATICFTGCDRSMSKPMMYAVVQPDMPTMDDPEAFTVAFVQAAVDLYKTEGIEAAITHYNNPANTEGQWYIFITDPNDTIVAHPIAPHFVGDDLKSTVAIDGGPAGVNIAMATETGRWSEYLWTNPATKKVAQKRTWSIRYDGYLFGSGYNAPWQPDPATLPGVSKKDPVAFTHAFVLAAIARYEFEGLEATLEYYNDPASIDGQWYVFINDADDLLLAHAPRQDLLGTTLQDIVGPDGAPVGVKIAEATEVGLWVEYLWENPATGENEQKHTWAIRHDGYLFGSGYHESAATDAGMAGAAEQ